jgi:DNA-binding protein H-NS
MAKLTVSSIRSQIAALEAKAARLTEVETKKSVAQVKALMKSLGVTMEHLGSKVANAAEDAKNAVFGKSKPAKKAAAKRSGSGDARYRDPKTGATWTGRGRAPAWIASVKNRADYLIDQVASAVATPSAPAKKAKKTTAKKAAKKAAGKAVTTAKAAAKKVTRAAKKVASKKVTAKAAPAKKRATAKPATKKAAAPRKAAVKKSAAPSAAADAPSASNADAAN